MKQPSAPGKPKSPFKPRFSIRKSVLPQQSFTLSRKLLFMG